MNGESDIVLFITIKMVKAMHVLTSRNKKSKENKVTAYQSIEEARAYIQRATKFYHTKHRR
jgi:hypothetical protein